MAFGKSLFALLVAVMVAFASANEFHHPEVSDLKGSEFTEKVSRIAFGTFVLVNSQYLWHGAISAACSPRPARILHWSFCAGQRWWCLVCEVLRSVVWCVFPQPGPVESCVLAQPFSKRDNHPTLYRALQASCCGLGQVG